MSLAVLRELLQAGAFTPEQKAALEQWLLEVLPAALVEGTGITITADADLGTLTFDSSSDARQVCLQYQIGDMTTVITTGTNKATFRLPFAFVVEYARASLHTASSSGAFIVDINIGGNSIFGANKLSIDANEKTSTTATTAATFTATSFADDSEILIDVDDDGTNATGLVVYLIGHVPVEPIVRLQENDVTRLFEDGTTRYLEI